MQILYSIIDLAKSFELGAKDPNIKFYLAYEDEKWKATVISNKKYYAEAVGETPDEVLHALQKELIGFNESIIKRLTNKLKTWISDPDKNGLKLLK